MGGGIYESLPVGVGFRPNGEQLIDGYLIAKLLGENSRLKMEIPGTEAQVDIIPDVDDLCKLEPWELPTTLNHPVFSKFQRDQHEREGYFFSRLQKKYAKGHQVKRATNAGFWKPTGRELLITRMATREVIGKRKTLVFYRRDGRSVARTPWIIYEYHADKRFVPDDETDYVVCRFKRKAGTGILIDQSGGPIETMTFGASNIHLQVLDGPPEDEFAINSVPYLVERAPLNGPPNYERVPLDGPLSEEFAIDSIGYPYERAPLGPLEDEFAIDFDSVGYPYERAPLEGPLEDEFAIDSVGYPYERAPLDGSPKYEFAFDSDGFPYERLIRKS